MNIHDDSTKLKYRRRNLLATRNRGKRNLCRAAGQKCLKNSLVLDEGLTMVRLRATKGKRWRKGQSCVSNPSTTVHRDAALRGAIVRGGQTTKKSRLTVEAVAKHTQNQDEEGDVKIKGDEEFSMKSGQTFGAFSVSGLTDCSNPAFDSVRRFWDSPSAQHKEVSQVNIVT